MEQFLNLTKDVLIEHNATLTLPKWLPNNLKPVAVWYREPLLAIIAYDEKQVDNYDQLKINIQVSSLEPVNIKVLNRVVQDLREQSNSASLLEVNNMHVLIVEDVEGIDVYYYYVVYIYDFNGNLEYTLTVKMPISYNDLIKIIESMKPVINPTP